jgi:hypothetical protein
MLGNAVQVRVPPKCATVHVERVVGCARSDGTIEVVPQLPRPRFLIVSGGIGALVEWGDANRIAIESFLGLVGHL